MKFYRALAEADFVVRVFEVPEGAVMDGEYQSICLISALETAPVEVRELRPCLVV